MGNKLLVAYDIPSKPTITSNELRWSIHNGKTKGKDGTQISVFVFEKKTIDSLRKAHRDKYLEILRADVTNSQRLRHPRIIGVIDALCEERSSLVFSAQPVIATLSSVLAVRQLDFLEAKSGLLDIAYALEFVHNDAKLMHLNVSPHVIFISRNGRWVLGGFGFAQAVDNPTDLYSSPFNFGCNDNRFCLEPRLNICSPEAASVPGRIGCPSDVFSFGLVCLQALAPNKGVPYSGDALNYGGISTTIAELPPKVKQGLDYMLNLNPTQRVKLSDLLKTEFFQDPHVRALHFLDAIDEKDEHARSQFLHGLTALLKDMSSPLLQEAVVRDRLLPALGNLLTKCQLESMTSTLTNIFVCIEEGTSRNMGKPVTDPHHFSDYVWPHMKPLFTNPKMPIESVTLIIQKMGVLLPFLGDKDIEVTILPFVSKCMDLKHAKIHCELLAVMPVIRQHFRAEIKHKALTWMLKVGKFAEKHVRGQVLDALAESFSSYEKSVVCGTIINGLIEIYISVETSFQDHLEQSQTGTIKILKILEEISKHFGHKTACREVLPRLIPLLADEKLTRNEFEEVRRIINTLIVYTEDQREEEFRKRVAKEKEVQLSLGVSSEPFNLMLL